MPISPDAPSLPYVPSTEGFKALQMHSKAFHPSHVCCSATERCMRCEINHTSPYWAAVTAQQPRCCSASTSAALGSLLRATRRGGTWVKRGAPPCQAEPQEGRWPVLKSLPCQEHPVPRALTSREGTRPWWVTLLLRVPLLLWLCCPCLEWRGCTRRAVWRQWPGCAHPPPEGAVCCPSHSSSILGALGLQGARELALCC